MRPVAQLPPAVRAEIGVVLTDIDDTLTDHGRLPASAYAALERLHAAGLKVIPVTGRPAGWCDLIARQWPVDGVVGENGAFYFRYDDARRRMTRRFVRSTAERQADRVVLDATCSEILREVPGSAVSTDQPYREADLAIDYCEDVPPLPAVEVARIVQIFERRGATAKASSIHVNGWFGAYDKLTTSLLLLSEVFGIDGRIKEASIAFAGDSPNDGPMFSFFSNSIGVANVLRFARGIAAHPKWVTRQEGGDGFVELADLLLEGRA